MSNEYDQNDIVQRLSEATAEAKIIEEKLREVDRESYDSIAKDFAARYQLLMDDAEKELKDGYNSGVGLTNARMCEINRERDNYMVTVNGVMTLYQELENQK